MEDFPLECLQEYFKIQSGGSLPYYSGHMLPSDYKRGSGLGNLLSSAARMLLPFAKKAIKSPLVRNIGRDLGKTALAVTSDVISGEKPLRQALSHRSKELINRGIKRGIDHIENQNQQRAANKKRTRNKNKSKRSRRNRSLF